MAVESSYSGYFRSARWAATAVDNPDNTLYGNIDTIDLDVGLLNPWTIGYTYGFPFASYSSCPIVAVVPTATPVGTENPYPLGQPYQNEAYNMILRMFRMDTFTFEADIYAGTIPVDITSNTLIFTAKWSLRDPDADAVFIKTIGDGIVITDGTNGKCQVTIESEDTQGLPLHETALYYDLQMTDIAGKRYTVLSGRLLVRPDTTQA